MNWIDLRENLNALIYGDRYTKPQGYWAVVRIFRKYQLSSFWHEASKSAVGGPKYEYDDHLVRLICMPTRRFSDTKVLGNIADALPEDKDTHVYAIPYSDKYERLPDIEDNIFHIDKYASVDAPSPPFKAVARFKITDQYILNGDYGRAELIYGIAERIHGES